MRKRWCLSSNASGGTLLRFWRRKNADREAHYLQTHHRYLYPKSLVHYEVKRCD